MNRRRRRHSIRTKRASVVIEKEAFSFVPLSVDSRQRDAPCSIHVIPKPSEGRDHGCLFPSYYAEQATSYDDLDGASLKRSRYTSSASISHFGRGPHRGLGNLNRVLHIACGTGRRRAWGIRATYHSLNYDSGDGIDISASMVAAGPGAGHVTGRIGMYGMNVRSSERRFVRRGGIPVRLRTHPNWAKNAGRAWKKCSAALRPGGRFYFDVFNLDNANEWGPEAPQGV